MESIKSLATHYAEIVGWGVIPCNGKEPLYLPPNHDKGAKSPTQDSLIIASWPDTIQAYGIVMGDDLVVIDQDSQEAMTIYEEWIRDLNLPPTMEVKTPNGRHAYFRIADKVHGSIKSVATGIDVIAGNKYVVGPGSTTTAPYTLVDDTPPALLPDNLRAKIESHIIDRLIDTTTTVTTPSEMDYPRTLERARAYMIKPEGVPEGSRDNAAYFLACRLTVGFGLTDEDALCLMRGWNSRNSPPLPDGQVISKIEGARERATETPYAYAAGKVESFDPAELLRNHEPGQDRDVPYVPAQLEPITAPIMAESNPAITSESAPVISLPSPSESRPSWVSQIISVKQCLKGFNPPPYIVGGLIPESSVVAFYGSPGSHKSNTILSLALHIATGRHWHGFGIDKAVPVLWMDSDNGQDIVQERVAAFIRGMDSQDKPDTIPFHTVSFPSPLLNMRNKDSLKVFANTIQDTGAKVVVIDNLLSVCPGADENGAEMADICRCFRILAEEYRVAFIIIHHTRKKQANQANNSNEMLRGHGSIEASLDATYMVTVRKAEGSPIVTIKQGKARRAPIDKVFIQFKFTTDPTGWNLHSAQYVAATGTWREEDDDENEPKRKRRSEKTAAKKESMADFHMNLVVSFCKDGFIKRDMLQEKLKGFMSKHDAQALVNRAIDQGILKRDTDNPRHEAMIGLMPPHLVDAAKA